MYVKPAKTAFLKAAMKATENGKVSKREAKKSLRAFKKDLAASKDRQLSKALAADIYHEQFSEAANSRFSKNAKPVLRKLARKIGPPV